MSVNPHILDYFKRINANGRLAHAYLFSGPGGSGKAQTAAAIAMMLNCETPGGKDFCGQCGSCRKITAGNHPDMVILSAALGETIKIDEIRSFIQRSMLRPFEAKWKVFMVHNAERMTKDAANAFLKTLEEPNKQTLMILTSSVPELCLDTIKSRCQIVNFYPSSQALVVQGLITECSIDEASAQMLAYFSEGSPSRAKELLDEKFSAKKNRIIDEMVMKRQSEEFLRKVLSDKEETQTVLKVLLSFFRDLMLLKVGAGEVRLANRDRIRDLRPLALAFTFDDIDRIIGEIVRTMRLLKENLNVKMSVSLIKEMVFR